MSIKCPVTGIECSVLRLAEEMPGSWKFPDETGTTTVNHTINASEAKYRSSQNPDWCTLYQTKEKCGALVGHALELRKNFFGDNQ